jgi:hypothetical protein
MHAGKSEKLLSGLFLVKHAKPRVTMCHGKFIIIQHIYANFQPIIGAIRYRVFSRDTYVNNIYLHLYFCLYLYMCMYYYIQFRMQSVGLNLAMKYLTTT